MSMSVQEAEKERKDLIARYIKDSAYTGFESEADGVNHLAFITRDIEKTIEFYTQVIRSGSWAATRLWRRKLAKC